ncbi:signal recognition particle-docking protein FtsY [Candidatus Hecatella orcuttiae]|jgi:fused signal recognition particle receptor|uniref:signal recognition particle-docking protein FtsY n=1 Tax=Candidatus Hecatella orcuttiae TaxID=1935119 RepID=UPI002867EEA0|nr:signal recognition particle-docking protein FtsY [Candidatus Hecatella orcuttiae]
MFEKLRKAFHTFADRISTQELTGGKLQSLLEEFKIMLLENDVALSVAEKVVEDLRAKVEGLRVGRLGDKRGPVLEALRGVLCEVLTGCGSLDLLKLAEERRKESRPLTLVFVGINGTGKTTTIAKMAKFFLDRGFSTVLACSDTFRAGAIEQLEEHARRLGIKMVKHAYGSDPASVAFDAVAHAQARGINVVLVDTAGRMETDRNLMEEMRKIVRAAEADAVLFVGDALTGNDAVAQAQEFNRYVQVDGSILTKMDADAKGGAVVSIAYVTGKPIVFMGVGQAYGDLKPFHVEEFISQLLGDH